MSKKQSSNTANKKDMIIKGLEKRFGKCLSSGNALVQSKDNLKVIHVGPNLDMAMHGGILEGTWTVISGDPKSGKTTTCLQICKNAQDMGKPVIYIDAESRLKKYNLLGIQGLNLDDIQIVHSPEGEAPLAAEDFLLICESLLRSEENCGALCVIDSTSSLVPRSELDADPSATMRATLPRLLSHWIKKNAQIVTKNRIAVILITHFITNTSGYGKIKVPDCGVMVQYQADNRLSVKRFEPWEEGDKQIGQIVHWDIQCSALGACGSCTSYIRFGYGIDDIKETMDIAEMFGIIEKSGSWYTIPAEITKSEAVKLQGSGNVREYLCDNQDVLSTIKSQVSKLCYE